MDVFCYRNPTAPTLLEGGEIINGITSKMWIERYADHGEFEFVGPAEYQLQEKLPLGSFVSHIGTDQVMIVENHEIKQDRNKDPEVVITGRSFTSFIEQRVLSANKATFPHTESDGKIDVLITGSGTERAASRIRNMIRRTLVAADTINDDEAIPYFDVAADVTVPVPWMPKETTGSLTFPAGPLDKPVIEQLNLYDYGMKALRPGPWIPAGISPTYMVYLIHNGVDRREEVMFSHAKGDIVDAEYLWSIKPDKNVAVVTGKWVQTVFPNPASHTAVSRRTLHVDGTEADSHLTAAPSGSALNAVVDDMEDLAEAALRKHSKLGLLKATISEDVATYKYRTDYNLGDIVFVSGNYNESAYMRVVEYVEVEDDTESRGYPVLAITSRLEDDQPGEIPSG